MFSHCNFYSAAGRGEECINVMKNALKILLGGKLYCILCSIIKVPKNCSLKYRALGTVK